MRINATLQYKPDNFQTDECQIEKVVELSHEEFCGLLATPMQEHAFIAENKNCMFRKDGVIHCLLALGEDSNNGLLIESDGFPYARFAAYVPGIRDIINAEMDRAVDFFVQNGTENTFSTTWYIYTDDLEEHSGLTIREDSGLDKMLLEAFKRRKEVANAVLTGDSIELNFHPEFCPGIAAYMKPDRVPQQSM